MSILTFSVDLTDRADIIKTAAMLESLALYGTTAKEKPDADIDTSGMEIERKIPASEGGTGPETIETNAAGAIVATNSNVVSITDPKPQTEPEGSADPAPANGAETPVNGVTLADGIPWDPRIHSSNKKTLAKAPHGWKLKRGVDKTVVAEVEAELRAAMAASPTKPIETEPAAEVTTAAPTPGPTPGPTPTPEATPTAPVKYLVQDVPYTREELIGFNSGWNDTNIDALPVAEPEPASTTAPTPGPTPATTEAGTDAMTFPQLLTKITAAKNAGTLTDEQVTAACNAQGLASMQLVGARPDLIPAINAALFV